MHAKSRPSYNVSQPSSITNIMASFLRQLIAGPRLRHAPADLDLCYVTPFLIATSGPSGTYPQRAYRNPLDQLVAFLDKEHGDDWAIWEFRAEGTGYPDSEVRGKVNHWPWPDHHPPPFGLVPGIVGGMQKWLRREGEHVEGEEERVADAAAEGDRGAGKAGRVVVVHCKAGKGRSGSMACSYLIAECGWTAADALQQFTSRRMRPGFGAGVSIPSQLRWVGYVDRWTKGGKKYMEQQVEILEVHVWGLRTGVKVAIDGYVDEGKVIKEFHVFSKDERTAVDKEGAGTPGVLGKLADAAGFDNEGKILPGDKPNGDAAKKQKRASALSYNNAGRSDSMDPVAGTGAVVFKPSSRVILPTSDINIDFERRNNAAYGWTMVTSVAHVWFNTFFEGNGPEQDGEADQDGLFEIDWDKMDGIKGSSRKGTRAFDRLAVVWKVRIYLSPSEKGAH